MAAAREAFDDGPVAAHDARRARRATCAPSAPALQSADRRPRPDLAARVAASLYAHRAVLGRDGAATAFESYADLADTFPFEEPRAARPAASSGCSCASRSASSGAIIPWNAPIALIAHKIGPGAARRVHASSSSASPEAPGAGYLVAEVAEEIGLPPGVLNVVTADREVSELLVRDPRVDKITFTGSTAAGRKIASLCGERIARCTLELGGKSAAVILDDADLAQVAASHLRAPSACSPARSARR